MKKELKDYLPFYLGSNYIIKYKYKTHHTRKALPRLTNGSYYNVVSLLRSPQYYDVKLVLRPLSDMTDEEGKEAELEWNKGRMLGESISRSLEIAYAYRVEFLLSKHFDLFGLIEAGLAIDKTTLKHQS